MNKFLLASTISMISFAAFAEPVQVQQIPSGQVYTENQTGSSVYQKQTVVRYNVPTCKNCQTTTTVNRVVSGTEPVVATVPCSTGACNNTCTSCGGIAPVAKKSCVFNNHKYAIANPLFVLKQGQFSSDTVAAAWRQPKRISNDLIYGSFEGWMAAEQVMYGITDWLSFKLQGGYSSYRRKKSTWKLDPDNANVRTPRNYSYDGTVGLQAHALDFCNFDLIVGVDATWGKKGYKNGSCKDSDDYKEITPYAIIGGQITKYVTPYLQAGYVFSVDTKDTDDIYMLQPGLYIQPSKYFAIHPYIRKTEHKRPEWNLGLDFYPYQNLAVGIEGSAISLEKHPMTSYGVSGRIKMTF